MLTEKFKSESKFFLAGKSTSEASITVHGSKTKLIFRDKDTEMLAVLGGKCSLGVCEFRGRDSIHTVCQITDADLGQVGLFKTTA